MVYEEVRKVLVPTVVNFVNKRHFRMQKHQGAERRIANKSAGYQSENHCDPRVPNRSWHALKLFEFGGFYRIAVETFAGGWLKRIERD